MRFSLFLLLTAWPTSAAESPFSAPAELRQAAAQLSQLPGAVAAEVLPGGSALEVRFEDQAALVAAKQANALPVYAAGVPVEAYSHGPAALSMARSLAARLLPPQVYLAGPWGFPDFDVENEVAYGKYVAKSRGAKPNPGHALLRLFESDIQTSGFATLNPWTDTVPPTLIAGVMFGAGKDPSGRPWSEGNLGERTMTKERLLHWIAVASRSPHVRPSEYSYSPDSSLEHLEEVYRNMVGDIIFRGNKQHVESADIVVANLNAYRGDIDDGTLWEALYALSLGKELVVLVDQAPPPSLGEGIFGRSNRWNMMISGALKERASQVRIFHSVDDVLTYLRNHPPIAGRAPRELDLP